MPKDPRRYLPGGPPQHRQAGVLAYFATSLAAAAAASDLKAAGFSVSRDRVPRHLEGDAPSNIEFDMSPGLTGGLDGRDLTLVAVSVDGEQQRDRALQIIRRHGGRMGP